MQTIYYILLVAHIVCGYFSLLAGTIIIFSKKGTKFHKINGKIFFYSMLVLCFSSIYIAISKEIIFLLHIGIFVFYQNYAGFKSVKNKSLTPKALDFIILIINLVNSGFMLFSFNTVLIIFGLISAFLGMGDIKLYLQLVTKKEIHPKTWLRRHIGMMMGAFIGTLTAFIVVNVNNFEPAWLIWLAPTFILVPLMQYWTYRFTKIK